MKQTSVSTGGNETRVGPDEFVGLGWLLFSILLFTLVFLPVVLL